MGKSTPGPSKILCTYLIFPPVYYLPNTVPNKLKTIFLGEGGRGVPPTTMLVKWNGTKEGIDELYLWTLNQILNDLCPHQTV